MLNTEFIASKLVTASNQLGHSCDGPSVHVRFIGGSVYKVSICSFSLSSIGSCDLVFVCSKVYQYFYIKSNYPLFIY